ncbi:MAG TPA: ribosomal protein S18-alanine N-acetyltransferase [Dehalococcoidales bacterium]|nr:MAG: ribosomal-protein-alanine N-acetyltransferase [Chloroflexi bacterium RBG_16_60_22]HJX14048.1 ribosomal protein S18-alanine N-acetyltransferase [Dehalococcoidales bacterium]
MIYSIRPMVKGDLGQVTEIDREAFPTQWPPANYLQELQNQLAHYIVARDDTKKVEVSHARPPRALSTLRSWLRWLGRRRPRPDDPPPRAFQQYIVGFSGIWVITDEAHITNIAVRQTYQGRGLGEMLLIATIDLARELNARSMTLEVRASNTVAQNLYTKYGFAKVGVRPGYYLDNREDGVIMTTENINSEAFQVNLKKLRKTLAGKLY